MFYVEVRVDNFDINHMNIKKSDDNKFIVEYNKRSYLILIIIIITNIKQ